MKNLFVVFLILVWANGLSQSSSIHYKSNVRGSLTSGTVHSVKAIESTVVNVWTEAHTQTSTSYRNQTRPVVGVTTDSSVGIGFLAFTKRGITIFPNPTNQSFEVKSELEISKIMVFDLRGKLILEQRSNTSISSLNWAKGTYIISVFSGSNVTNTRLVKL